MEAGSGRSVPLRRRRRRRRPAASAAAPARCRGRTRKTPTSGESDKPNVKRGSHPDTWQDSASALLQKIPRTRTLGGFGASENTCILTTWTCQGSQGNYAPVLDRPMFIARVCIIRRAGGAAACGGGRGVRGQQHNTLQALFLFTSFPNTFAGWLRCCMRRRGRTAKAARRTRVLRRRRRPRSPVCRCRRPPPPPPTPTPTSGAVQSPIVFRSLSLPVVPVQ